MKGHLYFYEPYVQSIKKLSKPFVLGTCHHECSKFEDLCKS